MTNNIYKNFLVLILLLTSIFFQSFYAQTVFWSEDFETDGTGTRYTADAQFIDTDEDYFGRIQNVAGNLTYVGCTTTSIDVTNDYTGQSGAFFMAGEDMNDIGGCGVNGSEIRNIIFSGVNIFGASEMTFKILVANGASDGCGTTNSRWDEGEGLKVFYTKDGGGETVGICFAPSLNCNPGGNTSNEPLHLDLNCDGNGTDGFVNNVFTEYSFTIPAGGNSMNIRVEISANAGDEEIAFDNLRLEAVTPPMVAPVELASFEVHAINKEITINWATASEINNDYFEIERSSNGRNFQSIAMQKGNGFSSELLQYNFIDTEPVNGLNYYRLSQVDFDGTTTKSDIRTARIEANNSISIFPNPATSFISIKGLDNDAEYSISIINLQGQTILNNNSVETIDISTIIPGMYFIQVEQNGEIFLEKFLKE